MAKRPASSFDSAIDEITSDGGNITVIAPVAHLARDHRGLNIIDAHVVCHDKADFVREISRLSSDISSRYIEIGRYLIEAKDRLGHGEFEPMIEAELPFGARQAQRLMVVAKAIDDGIFPRDQLPPSHSTVYELVSLKAEERERAIEEGVVNPEVTREDVIAFRKLVRGDRGPRPLTSPGAINSRIRKLEAQRESINAEIARLHALLR
ncbi:hypothetical protein CU669_16940 [Paramagnetospirillum kuznetsovii]|uniref:DUF3102 domain-containing protein n=1 Tax=Paramagnetospirillum kuznetsovii TaxID=2053833 RepID=A0A364NUM5_9PROT|nr:DUF3102 domain-containing protein [Paramagnetospirillum kuznetsovii]RAU20766.1 hypothetical protein CU669_16940 [Paramagnetospirillum kuznetsovii]